jgi:hypothetical protein
MVEIGAISAGVFVGALAGEVPKSTEMLHASVARAKIQNRAKSLFKAIIFSYSLSVFNITQIMDVNMYFVCGFLEIVDEA